jgi:hypothetical protein
MFFCTPDQALRTRPQALRARLPSERPSGTGHVFLYAGPRHSVPGPGTPCQATIRTSLRDGPMFFPTPGPGTPCQASIGSSLRDGRSPALCIHILCLSRTLQKLVFQLQSGASLERFAKNGKTLCNREQQWECEVRFGLIPECD